MSKIIVGNDFRTLRLSTFDLIKNQLSVSMSVFWLFLRFIILNQSSMKKLSLFLMLVFVLSNCSKSDSYSEEVVVDTASNESMEVVDQVKFVKPVLAKAEETTTDNTGEKATTDKKIIKTGDIKFETNDLEATYKQVIGAVKQQQGIIQNDSEGKEYGSVFRRMTIRVPSQRFDVFVSEISKGVSYFDNKDISAVDVTEQYIDIEARLKAKKTLEARYLELLKKANKVSEMLEIEAQLSAIREEIEAKEGQFRYMKSQIAMSTITLEFYKTVAEKEGSLVPYGTKIWNALGDGFSSLSETLLGLLSIWPFAILAVVLGYYIRKRFKKKV